MPSAVSVGHSRFADPPPRVRAPSPGPATDRDRGRGGAYVHAAAKPRPMYDIVGGERYWTPSAGCSVAFSVDGGYITAGHCGGTGETTSGDDRPGPDPGSCDGHETNAAGSPTSGASTYQPNGSYHQSTSSGARTACLDGPGGTAGRYRYRVHAYGGSGEYTLGFSRPWRAAPAARSPPGAAGAFPCVTGRSRTNLGADSAGTKKVCQ